MPAKSTTTKTFQTTSLRGLFLTLTAITLIELLSQMIYELPTLTPLLAVIALTTFSGGLRAGMISAALMSFYGIYYFSIRGQVFHYTPDNLVRLTLLPVTAVPIALIVGLLRRSLQASERQLRQELNFRQAIDNSLGEGVYALDREGRLTSMNPAAEQLLGWAEAELQGRIMHDVIHFQHADGSPFPREACTGLMEVLRTGTVHRAENDAFTRKDGTIFPVAYSAAPIVVEQQVTGVVVAFRDMTERKRSEEQLAHERGEAERLSELDRLRSNFIATTSHNLKTPLTAIQAGLGMVETSAAARLRADELRLISNVRRNTQRLGMVINDLLTLNQISAGALRLDRELIDLRTVVCEALSAVHPLIQQKCQILELDLPEPLPCAGDAWRLEQVVVNLLSNAHLHTPTGTSITVAGHADASEIRLSVSDSGPGIQAEQRDAIFDRFHRLSSNDGGSGLGLAITRGIVELHGGRIWLESRPGEGATFHVALPRHSDGGIS